MADEREKDQFDTEGKSDQQTTGQQGQKSEFGQQRGQQPGGLGSQETMSGQGSTGQDSGGSFDSQSSSGETQSDTLTTDQSDGQGQSSTGQSGSRDEGFIGSKRPGSEDAGFAKQGRGALDEKDEESETARAAATSNVPPFEVRRRAPSGARRSFYAGSLARSAASRSIQGAKLGRDRIEST
jgi:hypothetical protein